MKILHALAYYLAVTSTALPFYPFAFAYRLGAIDYDGYVNTTQNHIDGALMKHVLGSIVETCQTVTTHSDSALLKRVPGDIIEARQFEWDIPAAAIIIVSVTAIIIALAWIGDDEPVRGNDVQFIVDHFD